MVTVEVKSRYATMVDNVMMTMGQMVEEAENKVKDIVDNVKAIA